MNSSHSNGFSNGNLEDPPIENQYLSHSTHYKDHNVYYPSSPFHRSIQYSQLKAIFCTKGNQHQVDEVKANIGDSYTVPNIEKYHCSTEFIEDGTLS